MDTNTALRRAARIQYAVLRAPLHLLDERVVQRCLDEGSPARRTFETALAALDDAVHTWLDDTPPEPAEPVVKTTPPAADDEAAAHDDETDEDEGQQLEQLTDELLAEEETETFVGELAEDDELRQVQAELQAKRLIEEQQER